MIAGVTLYVRSIFGPLCRTRRNSVAFGLRRCDSVFESSSVHMFTFEWQVETVCVRICMCIVYVDEFVWVFSTVYITSTVVFFFAVTVLLSKELPLQLRLEGKQRGPWKIAEMLISSATTCPVTGESYRRRISAQIMRPRKRHPRT